MDIDKRTRSELKAYFVKNATPTESNFAEFIEAVLNQKDDGIVKEPGNPLCIEATGDATSQLRTINLYESLSDANPAFVFSLKPRQDPSDATTARAGFSISDAAGNSRLFIDQASGRVGLGTVETDAALTLRSAPANSPVGLTQNQVGGTATLELTTTDSAGQQATRLLLRGNDDAAHVELYRGARGAETATLFIDGATGHVGIGTGTSAPLGRLQVAGGALVPAKGSSESAGILFFHDTAGGGTDRGWIRYYTRSGEQNTLEIGTGNDLADHVALMPSGHVGVKTNSPAASLHVASGAGASLVAHGYLLLGSVTRSNLVLDDNEIQARNNGAAATLSLQHQGGDLSIHGGVGSGRQVVVLDDGRLGLGTASPDAKLSVIGVARAAQSDTETEYAEIGHDGANGYLNTAGDGHLELRHDGAAKVAIAADGDVGIGTNNPQARLQVVGGAIMPATGNSESAGLFFPKDPFGGSGDRAWMRYFARSGEAATLEIGIANDGDDHLALMASGNVGVGTQSPATKLSVIGPVRGANDSAESEYTEMGHGGSHGYLNTVGDGNLEFRHDGTTKMAITAGGDVGVGTNEPQSRLHLVDGADASLTDHGYLVLGSTTGLNVVFDNNEIIARNNGAASTLHLQAEGGHLQVGSSKLVVLDDGSVGIGTTSPDAKLSVVGAVRGANATNETEYTEIGHGGDNGYVNTVGDGNLEFRHDGTTLMSLRSNGNLGIGHDAPGEKLYVNGDAKIELGLDARGVVVDRVTGSHIERDGAFYRYDGQAYITVDDNLYIRDKNSIVRFHFNTNNGDFSKISDGRLKTRIQNLGNCLDKVLSIRGVRYAWREEPGETAPHLGFVAQNVEQVFPELVGRTADGTKSLDYQGLLAPLIEALREQQEQIDALRAQLAT